MSWLRSHWIAVAVSTVLFLIGVGMGASGQEESQEAAAAPQVRTVERTKTVTVLDKLDAKQKQKLADALAFVDERKSKLVARSKTLDAKAVSLTAKESALAERERAVSGEEARIEASMFSDGSYLVGKDIPSGSYVADGGTGGGCYWARMNGSNTDIIDNHISQTGPVRATIYDGEIFETRDCGDWQRG
jgi:hypothetical protein